VSYTVFALVFLGWVGCNIIIVLCLLGAILAGAGGTVRVSRMSAERMGLSRRTVQHTRARQCAAVTQVYAAPAERAGEIPIVSRGFRGWGGGGRINLEHGDELVSLPLVHLGTTHKCEVHAQRAVDTGAIQAHENAVGRRGPRRVLGAAVKARLRKRQTGAGSRQSTC